VFRLWCGVAAGHARGRYRCAARTAKELMRILTTLRRGRALLARSRRDDELREEIEQHIADRTRSLIDEGMDPRDAAFEARRLFGNVMAIREETRDMWTFRWIESFLQDTRFGARLLRRSPVFTLAAVASLSIGIGSAAAVFSLADGLLFRTLPVPDPQQLVLFRWISGPETAFRSLNGFGVQNESGTSSTSFSYKLFDTSREKLASQVDLFAFADLYRANLSVDGRPETAYAQVVSGNYFTALGVSPALGRLLGPADDRIDAPPSAVIGHEFWRRRFGSSPDVLGKLVVLNGLSFTIAGVMPAGFNGAMQVGQRCDVMVPIAQYKAVTRGDEDPLDPEFWWVLMMGRLKPDVSAAQLQPNADLLLKQSVTSARPNFPATSLPRMSVEPGGQGQTEMRNDMRQPMRLMAMVVTIVLLVACANVANLLLARGRARGREIAVRTAIGAPRYRIVRQLLTEGMLLGIIASVLGLVLAQWISAALLPALAPDRDGLTVRYALDLRILGFTCALATACTILFALVPALRSTDSTLLPALQEHTRGSIGGRRRFSMGGALVVVQVALSMLLLPAAALLSWSALRLQHTNPGFDPSNLLIFSVDTSLNGYSEQRSRTFAAQALDALRAVPGVTNASLTDHRLISNSSSIGVGRPEGVPAPAPGTKEGRDFAREHRAWRLAVDDKFFETMQIPLLRGHGFPPAMSSGSPRVAVVNTKLAQQLFGTVDVVGRRFVLGLAANAPAVEIIGVAADAHYTSIQQGVVPTAYLPIQQARLNRMTFAVRTASDPMSLAPTLRETLRGIDDGLPIFDVRTQQEQILRSLAQERLFANLSVLLGVVTLTLSGIGLYGLLAYAVTRRTPEIGVRIALGAERAHVRWMMLRQSLVLVAAGLALGIPGAIASRSVVANLLVDLSATDPRAIVAAAVVMLAVGLAAAYVPARRASRIDPLTALRAE
jgi:predicted permease